MSIALGRRTSVSNGRPAMRYHPVQMLHRDEVLTLPLVNLEHHADIGVVQRRRRLRLALEAGKSLRVLGYFIRQEFQGDEAVELDVLGFVDDAHPTTTKLLDDAVVRDGFADQLERLSNLGRQP